MTSRKAYFVVDDAESAGTDFICVGCDNSPSPTINCMECEIEYGICEPCLQYCHDENKMVKCPSCGEWDGG